MSLRTLRRWLWGMSLGGFVTAVIAVGIVSSSSLSVAPPAELDFHLPDATDSEQVPLNDRPPLDAAMAACAKELQRPLVESKPPPPKPKPETEVAKSAPPPPPPKPPQVSVLGTMLEAGASRALLRTGMARIEVRGEGDEMETMPDVRLVEIKSDGVVVSYRGTRFELETPRRKSLDLVE